MSIDAKVELVGQHREEHGLGKCLTAVGLSPSTWHYRQQRVPPESRDAVLRRAVVDVITDHSEYGYRRITPELTERLDRSVNTKAVRRVLRTYQLGLRRALPKQSPSVNHINGEQNGITIGLVCRRLPGSCRSRNLGCWRRRNRRTS
jgi:hypothetical protein